MGKILLWGDGGGGFWGYIISPSCSDSGVAVRAAAYIAPPSMDIQGAACILLGCSPLNGRTIDGRHGMYVIMAVTAFHEPYHPLSRSRTNFAFLHFFAVLMDLRTHCPAVELCVPLNVAGKKMLLEFNAHVALFFTAFTQTPVGRVEELLPASPPVASPPAFPSGPADSDSSRFLPNRKARRPVGDGREGKYSDNICASSRGRIQQDEGDVVLVKIARHCDGRTRCRYGWGEESSHIICNLRPVWWAKKNVAHQNF